jgi:malonyl-CoA O-methyltransferase
MTALLHQQQIRRRFSSAAAAYDAASPVQAEVARRVLALVPAHVQPRRILDAGCGTGRLLRLAHARWPEAELVGLDLAEGMIEQARRQLADIAPLRLEVGDAAIYEDKPFDLILSSSSLHWLRPLESGLAHVLNLLAPGGHLAAGLMTQATLRELRAARAAVAPQKDTPGRLPEWPDLHALFARPPGFRLLAAHEDNHEGRYGSAGELLDRLHVMGVTGGDLAQGARPLTRGELQALIGYYETHFSAPDGGVRATFSVGYVLVQRL